MLTVYYKKDNCDEEIREFKTKEEFVEWLARQLKINPDTKIVNIIETP